MTSRQRRERKPIAGVELRVEFKGADWPSNGILSSYPDAKKTRCGWGVRIRGRDPAEVAAKAKELLQIIRDGGERV